MTLCNLDQITKMSHVIIPEFCMYQFHMGLELANKVNRPARWALCLLGKEMV